MTAPVVGISGGSHIQQMSDALPDAARPASRTQQRCRADFIQEIVSIDKDTRTVKVRMLPDPRRYDQFERDGEPWYLDKYLHEAFRLRDMADAGWADVPIFCSQRTIDSATEYASERRVAVEHELETGEYTAPQQSARPHAEFANAKAERDVAFVSLDICGSTSYRKRDPRGFDAAFRIMLRELGTIVGQFQGSILKVTGDGFIAFLDFPGFCVQVDSTIDLCGSMLEVLHSGVNPAIVAKGLHPLSIRIGADYGPAFVSEIRVPTTGFAAPEVTSDALNRAVKIEQSSEPNTVRLGFDLYRLAHVQWLERCERVKFDSETVGIDDYPVYRLR